MKWPIHVERQVFDGPEEETVANLAIKVGNELREEEGIQQTLDVPQCRGKRNRSQSASL